jgi:tetratricopeptide (TPR) repeat protein
MDGLERVDPTRFEILRELAHGGMGCIMEAWDRRHERHVAIKLLLRSDAAARARFVREAKLTARLQHPGIVPVHEAGRWSDDEPFFAMKLVEGRPLDQVVAGTSRVDERLALLPNVIAMTDALAYAHDRGFVHRDLKPANVLVGAFGETVVIDWGLAKVVGAAGPAQPAEGTSGAMRADHSAELTQEGAAVGTPAYMPPEQARGEDIDARADVYALGALLYHVLAGAPPYAGSSGSGVIERVLAGPPPLLRVRVAEVPADLAAIVQKAMSRDPAGRYRDARAMAEDLRRFQAGQLVGAHAYSLGLLLRRWVVRHRAIVATASVLVAALLATVTMSVGRIVSERNRAQAAQREAEQARTVAVAQRDAAEKLVEFVVGDLKGKLEILGRMDMLQAIGEEVDRYYQSASQIGAPDVGTLLRRATALQAVAVAETSKLDPSVAAPLFEHATALAERALSLEPKSLDAEVLLVNLLVAQAGPAMDLGHMDVALADAERASDIGARALAQHPDEPRAMVGLSRARRRQALILRDIGRINEAMPLYVDVCALLESALTVSPSNFEVRRQTGWAYFERGDTAMVRGDFAGATASFHRSIEIREALLADYPGEDRTADLAWALTKASCAELGLGDFDKAIGDGTRAVHVQEQALGADPSSATRQRDLVGALQLLCMTEVTLGRYADAVAHCTRAMTLVEGLGGDGSNLLVKDDVAVVLATLGVAELRSGQVHAGRLLLERASAISASILRSGTIKVLSSSVVGADLAAAQLADGDRAAALTTARDTIASAAQRPGDARMLCSAARAQMVIGDTTGSLEAYRSAHDGLVRDCLRGTDPLQDPVDAAESALKLARALGRDPSARAEARSLIDEVVQTLGGMEESHTLIPRGAELLRQARGLAGKRP